MIPKIIHYCWFGGGEKPALAKKCIESWKKFCPDYEIIEWNEDNTNLCLNSYTKWCYDNKQFAFLSDYIRLIVIEKYGGIYFDTDVEIIRAFDDLLVYKAFFGFETYEFVNTGIGFGAEAHNSIVEQMLREYEPLLDGRHGAVGCPGLNTDALLKFGLKQNGRLQELDDVMIFPADYFNPMDSTTGKLTKTENTYSIHRYSMSWIPKKTQIRVKIGRRVRRMLRAMRMGR